MNQAFSISNVLKTSFDQVKANLKFFVLLTLGAWFIQFIPNYLSEQTTSTTLSFVLSLVSWLVSTYITVALTTIAIKYVKTNQATFQDGMAKMNVFLRYLLGSVYYSLIVMVGLILLIIPGILWAIRYQFYGYFIIDQGLSAKEALAKSKQITQGRFGELFLFGLALVGINLVGALLLGVGLLVTVPVSMLAVTKVYQTLSGGKPPAPPVSAAQTPPSDSSTTNVWKTLRQN